MKSRDRRLFSFCGIGVAVLALPYLAADQAALGELVRNSDPSSDPHRSKIEKLGSAKHELYFSPQDEVDAKLISLIEKEKDDIRAAVYCLTHRGIIKALMEARKRGVNVELIVDPFTIKARAPLKRMAQSGISLYVWDPEPISTPLETSKPRCPLMHNKFCVFGQKTVWTGSFNFTSEASRANQENVVVLHDPAIGQRYMEEFERVKIEGCSTYRVYLANRTSKKKNHEKLPKP